MIIWYICSIPLGVYARMQQDTLIMDAMICDVEGRDYIRRSLTTTRNQALARAAGLTQDLLDAGGREILQVIRREKGEG
jgi:hydroxymethylbilane synthase